MTAQFMRAVYNILSEDKCKVKVFILLVSVTANVLTNVIDKLRPNFADNNSYHVVDLKYLRQDQPDETLRQYFQLAAYIGIDELQYVHDTRSEFVLKSMLFRSFQLAYEYVFYGRLCLGLEDQNDQIFDSVSSNWEQVVKTLRARAVQRRNHTNQVCNNELDDKIDIGNKENFFVIVSYENALNDVV